MNKIKVKLNQAGVREVCLQSAEVDTLLQDLGNDIKGRYGSEAKVRLEKGKGKRHRVFIDAPMKEASKDNKLLKAMK